MTLGIIICHLAVWDALAADGAKPTSNKPADLLNVIEAQMKWREKVEAENRRLKEEIESIRAESAVLSQSLKRMGEQRDAATNALQYLLINDYLMENRTQITSSLQKGWAPKRETLFAALWKQGRVLQFEVSDVFLYQSNVIACADFLWANSDGSGGVGRAHIWMDPMNEFVVTGSNIQEQTRVSAQELAAISGAPQRNAVTERLGSGESGRKQEVEAKLATHEPILSERTKEQLTTAGISVAAGVALKAATLFIEDYFKKR